jgi:GTPase SAR1 family protein
MWLDEIKQYKEYIQIVIVGNKCDLINKRVVSFEEGKNFANSKNLEFLETSAKTNDNIELVCLKKNLKNIN